MMNKALLSPGKIGTLELKNRVVMAPMGSFYSNTDGYVDDRLIDYMAARAKGGTGLVMLEFTAVDPNGQPPGLPCIYNDSYLPGLTKVAEAIKANGAKAAIQIAHCGRQTFGPPPHGEAVAASPLPCMASGTVGREMTEEDIWAAIEAFGDAAVRAVKAGFDLIEIHMAHGYLIQNFLSPYSNKRTDQWGGSWENRSRFAREVLRNVRKKIGPDFPISTRISGWEPVVPDGLKLEEQIKTAEMLEAEGSDCIHVSVGVYGMQHYLIPPLYMPKGLNLENAAEIKKHVKVPVMVVGRINDPYQADDIIASGQADFVAIGRGQIADPDFVNKFAEGRADDIIKCMACMEGCFLQSLQSKPNICIRNAATGRERQYELKPAKVQKKILVAGGGPAGLEVATTLKRRGHDVTLAEKSSVLGGDMLLAGVAPHKAEMGEAAAQMGRVAVRAGVRVMLQTEVTPALIEELKPEVVIVATGAKLAKPDIKGVDAANVVCFTDVARGTVSTKENVVVIGGHDAGCEIADFLASNGKKVTVMEKEDAMLKDINPNLFPRAGCLLEDLTKGNVELIAGANVIEVKGDTVVYVKDGQTCEKNGVDTVVLATGMEANDPLSAWLEKAGIEHYVLGNANKPSFLVDAIHPAASLGRRI